MVWRLLFLQYSGGTNMKRVLLGLFILSSSFLSLESYAAPRCQIIVHNSQQAAQTPEISVIVGTNRKGSNSSVISNHIVNTLSEMGPVKINLIDLAELPPSLLRADYFDKKPKGFQENFVSPIERASSIVFVIPEYDGTVPGVLSFYLNHMRASLDQKSVALVGISAGKWGARSALDTFKGTLTHRRARVLGDLQINIENVESKVSDSKLTDAYSVKRLKQSLQELTRLTQVNSGFTAQQQLAKKAKLLIGRPTEMTLNNKVQIEGPLAKTIVESNGTLSYVQFGGPTRMKLNNQTIQGQGYERHADGYGMPLGPVVGLKTQWHTKKSLEENNILAGTGLLAVGKRVKLKYESGVLIDGKISSHQFDEAGNLIVMTFSQVQVTKGSDILFRKEWGEFDVAIADHALDFDLVE